MSFPYSRMIPNLPGFPDRFRRSGLNGLGRVFRLIGPDRFIFPSEMYYEKRNTV